MRHYEIIIIVHPNQSVQMPEILKKYQDIVSEGGGIVHRLEDWGRKHLAYSIHKVYKAHYALFNIECSKEVLDKLSHNFRFNDIILRNLIIKRKKKITEDSVMKQRQEAQNKEQKTKANTKIGNK